VFVIDWDDVMLAPKERDFLFVGAAPADDAAGQDIAPFFQGYGQAEIDWVALTYYLWERVVQDLIECARDVFFRKDLEEATRAEAAQLFCDVLADGGEVTTAQAATARLPSAYRPGAR
jgi:spectinomycin phosphotransferase